MAISLAFGVIFSTFITLILVPAGYIIMDDLKGLFSAQHDLDSLAMEPNVKVGLETIDR